MGWSTKINGTFVQEKSQYRWSRLMIWGRNCIGGFKHVHIIWNGTLLAQSYADEITQTSCCTLNRSHWWIFSFNGWQWQTSYSLTCEEHIWNGNNSADEVVSMLFQLKSNQSCLGHTQMMHYSGMNNSIDCPGLGDCIIMPDLIQFWSTCLKQKEYSI